MREPTNVHQTTIEATPIEILTSEAARIIKMIHMVAQVKKRENTKRDMIRNLIEQQESMQKPLPVLKMDPSIFTGSSSANFPRREALLFLSKDEFGSCAGKTFIVFQ